MGRELNNRAIWYPESDAQKTGEEYKKSMFYHLTEGVFKQFVDLVKKSESDDSIPELMLCFRSNKDSVTIYYKNHIVWNLSIRKTVPEVSISANHARYSDNWIDILSSIGMDRNKLEERKNKLKEEGTIIKIGTFSRSADKLPEDYAENTIHKLTGMIDDYFDVEKDLDFFQNRKAYKGYDRKNKKHIEGKRDLVEKKRQQEYYLNNRSFCDGYFVYDMEFQHEYGKESEKKTDFQYMGINKANQTDCLAIRYDNKGKPVKLAFVEIKSIKSSMMDSKKDGSGLRAHMINMDKYITKHLDYMKLRLKEAQDILTLYNKLGLRGVSKDMCEADLSKLELFGNQEIVLVYTDSAREYIETENGKKWRDKTLAGFPTKEGAYNIVQILQ